jgi:hypothetical protein
MAPKPSWLGRVINSRPQFNRQQDGLREPDVSRLAGKHVAFL